MPQSKKKRTVAPPKKGTTRNSKNTTSKTSAKKAMEKKQQQKQRAVSALGPWLLVLLAAFIGFSLLLPDYSGVVGKALNTFLRGLFSAGAYALPIVLIASAIFFKRDYENSFTKQRVVFSVFAVVGFSAFYHVFAPSLDKVFALDKLWAGGAKLSGGGVIGGLLASSLRVLLGKPGLIIISLLMILVFGTFIFGFTPADLAEYVAYYFKGKREQTKAVKKERAVYHNKPEAYLPDDEPVVQETPETPMVDPAIFERIREEVNNSFVVDEGTGEIIEEPIIPEPPKGQKMFPDEEGEVELDILIENGEPVFNTAQDEEEDGEEEELEVERSEIVVTEEPKPEPKPKPVYVFPPITLLNRDTSPKNEDVTDELRTNANKLVETLSSFKVRTKIVDISRGPTITRYELQPEEGVRVRAIANLVDDISLSLASSGIRIEAPIPGKAAVGIEVPNKSVSTVYLRELLENPSFKNNKSRVTVSLGMDVAGTPIFVDIAKMPHLLIAGATGMGKSVCINSMIVSLLYKASPEEVKLILIDPKKVELNVYNALPHLLIPVVSEPKKAAGALHWAVTEMERRFALIESVGVRDIYNFNMTTKDDPNYEYMPHVVIIIDELADLMMTAPDEVEDSICRLAQKARAAGMHLIIGTQRPSVDVITGLIKANIPSRIAFTVASQVDSRTIIDISGAEKLIGRGDMLYAPVGASKPMRVQGAFVSEQEVEAVTGFIRTKAGETEYDDDVIEKIEKEAAKCGVKKGSSSAGFAEADDGEERDPMLMPAIELAVESGKISTSLIQRRLSLGYGRAAKLIDQMQQMGVVSPPEGNKPRAVLMTKAEFLEMSVNNSPEE